MAECDACGKYENLPYQCRRCGRTFCAEHRLPENHDCPGLQNWDDPSGVFDSGFDDSVNDRGRTGSAVDRLTSTGGPLGYFRGNLAYTFLAIIWVVFLLEYVVGLLVAGTLDPGVFVANEAWQSIFTLSTAHPLYVWTWITSIFSHSPGFFFHIAGNSIALYFFGPLVERQIGSRKFALLFLASGVAAGLAQVGTALAFGNPTVVLGASGAIMAILGVITILNPDLRVMLIIPPIPLPIWVLTAFYAGASVLGILAPVSGGIAHWAHLVGLVIGLAYGQRVKASRSIPNRITLGRGGPGGPGGRGPF
ncbi:rhomboid family intramembrane serine protease [Halegenticoccus soli]|uniref:rhomboid family intramembrane serine protease n=1 Tax=Halegenticoccus soli TaxID=1985678 RepID=UPI000C6EC91D|nr:rhomboid family intramembrane serine protease [Halegenticoccus soli]